MAFNNFWMRGDSPDEPDTPRGSPAISPPGSRPNSRPNSRPPSWLAQFTIDENEETTNDSGERSSEKSSRGSTRSEKRPDPTREGEETPQEEGEAANNFQEISQHVPKNRPSNPINRSESYKERIHQKRQLRERRKTSDPNLSKSNNDIEVDAQALSFKSNSGSSSNSSLSTRSLESPSQSLDAVGGGSGQPPGQQATAWDSDMEAEPDPPDWTTSVPEEVFSQLSPNERKRQEVINELFYSERSHVQALRVLDQIFYKPMKEQQILPQDQISLLFSNLEEFLTFHSQFNTSMKAKRKENVVVGNISELLLNQFDGTYGESFKKAAATFCAKQQIALETLKERRRKDPKLNSFLSEAESNSYCRRRQLKDIIPTGWQRLTKYPLLFENLAKYTLKEEEEEHSRLKIAIEKSKELLNYVDMAVKEAEDEHRLAEIQRKLDKSQFDKTEHHIAQEFKNLDLTKHKLIHEGSLCWRMTNRQKTTELHVLLLDDAIILLQKQDEKFLLKFNSLALSPIIKVSTVLVRHNAVDKKALFLVNTSHNGAQIYDLVANSISEKRKWFKHISDAAEAYKQREGKHRGRTEGRTEGATSEFDSSEPRESRDHDDTLDTSADRSYPSAESPVPCVPSGSSTPQPGSPLTLADKLEGLEQPGTPEKSDKPARSPHASVGSEPPGSEVHVATSTAETTLVDPSEVVVSSRDVLTAEPVLTPLEKLRRKDELVRQILYEKQEIVADILHVPREEFENIADLAGEPSADKDPSELVLAAVNQAHELSLVVNEALRLSEEEAVAATSETTAAGGSRSGRIPGVPVHRLTGIASALTSHLTQLLNIMTERDEERERLRRELQRSREQLHALHEKYDHNGPSDPGSIPVNKSDEAKTETPPAEPTQSTAGEVMNT
uniref:Rho guanine nucleotide exchange factor 12 n=1 Tax=Lygus hesperus TaxID=30085 RepID=A0A0A9WXR4_LYGHE